MGTVTKRQHYVWRRYLRAWSDPKDMIWAYLIEQNKIIHVNLMGIAQANYFYRLQELNAKEINFVEQFINTIPSVLMSLATDLLNGVKHYSEICVEYREHPEKFSSISNIDEDLRSIEIDTFEKIHGIIEHMGDSLLDCRTAEDLQKLISSNHNYFEMLFYLCVQYCRTKTLKDRMIDGTKDRIFVQEVTEKSWPIISLIFAMSLCYGLFKNHPNISLISNATKYPFLTADQPVINALGSDVDENGYAKELELYYPIATDRAIIISFNNIINDKVIEADEDFVRKYNSLIISNATQYVFSDNEAQLKDLLP